MSKRNLISFVSAAVVVLIALIIGLYPSDKGPVICDMNKDGYCTEAGITFSIEPVPVFAMKENVFRATFAEPSIVPENTDLALHLTMPGMEMGTNRFRLKRIGPGSFSGKGVIPRCPSGKTLWRASILDISARELASFDFDVK